MSLADCLQKAGLQPDQMKALMSRASAIGEREALEESAGMVEENRLAVVRALAPVDVIKSAKVVDGKTTIEEVEFNPEQPPYVVAPVDGGRLIIDPKRFREGIDMAQKDGRINEEEAGKLRSQFELVEKARKERDKLLEYAGSVPELKAFASGAGRTAAALTTGAAVQRAASAAGPIAGFVGGVVGTIGGAIGYEKLQKLLAPYSETIRALNAASQLEPGYNAAGELTAFLAPVPSSVGRLARAGRMITAQKGAGAAASYLGRQVAVGAGIGAGVDASLQVLGKAVGWTNEDFDAGRMLEMGALAGLLSGYGVRFRDYDSPQVADILKRGMSGEGLATRAERDVFDRTVAQLGELAGRVRAGELVPERDLQFKARQVETFKGPVTEAETALRRRVEQIPAKAAAPASAETPVRPAEVPPGRPEAPEVPVSPEGGRTVVIGSKGAEFPARFAWVNRNEVQASHKGEMLARNPKYPLKNTRDYSRPEERDKALTTRNEWDPRIAVTDHPSAAVGPPMVAKIIDRSGEETLVALGGNNRQWAMQQLSPEKWQETLDLSSERAAAFGLPSAPGAESEIVRMLGTFDLRKPGEPERLQQMIDELNPSPGMVQSTASRAQIDAERMPLEELQDIPVELTPRNAQYVVNRWIESGRVDRNLTSAIAASGAQSQEYIQRLLVNAAFREPTLAEARHDPRQGSATFRGMLDAATPAMITLRSKGADEIANAITRAFTTLRDYTLHQGENKLGDALAHTAEQGDLLDPSAAVTQRIAQAMRDAVVLDKKGRVNANESLAGIEEIFVRVKRALDEYSPEPDMFGQVRSVEEVVMEAARNRKQAPEDVELFAELREATAEKFKDRAEMAAEGPDYSPVKAKSRESGYANVPLRGLKDIKIIQMPELVQLAKDLSGELPKLKKMRGARGVFSPMHGIIGLDPRIFSDQTAAAKTLAHEIGHLIDWLPDKYMTRGNLWGRLQTLRKYLKEQFGSAVVTNKEMRQELLDVTRFWKPYNPDEVPESYVKYRESAVELYADAISVLFNSPATLKSMAPNFYREFFNGLDKKPEAKKRFLELQAWLHKPQMSRLKDRQMKSHEMFARAEEIFERKIAEAEEQYRGFGGWLDRMKQAWFDVYEPVIRRERQAIQNGASVDPKDSARFFFDEHPLADNKVYRWLDHMWRRVVEPVEQAGFTMDEFGEVLFLNRVLNEDYTITRRIGGKIEADAGGRSKLANPLGMTPEVARLQLLRIRLEHGIRKMTLMDAAVDRFHDMVFGVVRDAYEAGMLTPEQWKLVRENKDNYATFVPIDYVDTFVPSGIYNQVGTLKEIQSPFTGTVLKTITLHRAIQYQRAKQKTIDVLNRYFGNEIRPAVTVRLPDGRSMPREPRDRGKRLFMLKDAGKPVWFEVPREIALMFDKVELPLIRATLQVLDWPFRNIFYPLFITWNPLFQFVRNPIRDIRRTALNRPWKSGGFAKSVLERFKNTPIAKDFVQEGKIDPLVAEMLSVFAITPPQASLQSTMGPEPESFRATLEKFHLVEPKEAHVLKRNKVTRPLYTLVNKIATAGQVREILPKVGVYRTLTRDLGWSPKQAAFYVRNYVGTPNYLKRGKYIHMAGVIYPFLNVWTKGWAADLRMMWKGDINKSRASWWFRWAMTSGIGVMLKVAAGAGLLGAALKEMYDGVSEYYKTNYDVVPLGMMPGGDFGKKVVFFPVPKDPTDRVISAIAYKALDYFARKSRGAPTQNALTEGFAVGAGDVPGLNPMIKIGQAWRDYAKGQNPLDDFRGQFVLSNAEYLSGGWDSMKPMLQFTYDQTGLKNFIGINTRADTTTELVLGAVPVLNGMIKISDYGFREQVRLTQEAEASRRARVRLSLPDDVQRLMTEYNYLQRITSELRTPVQSDRYLELSLWHPTVYDPAIEELYNAGGAESSNATKRFLEEGSRGFIRK